MRAARPKRWLAFFRGGFVGRYGARRTAMNAVDRPLRTRYGGALVCHETTGEQWRRVRGSWWRVVEGGAKRQQEIAGETSPARDAAGALDTPASAPAALACRQAP